MDPRPSYNTQRGFQNNNNNNFNNRGPYNNYRNTNNNFNQNHRGDYNHNQNNNNYNNFNNYQNHNQSGLFHQPPRPKGYQNNFQKERSHFERTVHFPVVGARENDQKFVVLCAYNPTHLFFGKDIDSHHRTCPDRQVFEQLRQAEHKFRQENYNN